MPQFYTCPPPSNLNLTMGGGGWRNSFGWNSNPATRRALVKTALGGASEFSDFGRKGLVFCNWTLTLSPAGRGGIYFNNLQSMNALSSNQFQLICIFCVFSGFYYIAFFTGSIMCPPCCPRGCREAAWRGHSWDLRGSGLARPAAKPRPPWCRSSATTPSAARCGCSARGTSTRPATCCATTTP